LQREALKGVPAADIAKPVPAGQVKSSEDLDKELAGMAGETGALADSGRQQKKAERDAAVLREEEAETVQLRKDLAALDNMADVQTVKDKKQARLDQLVEAKRMAKPLSARIKDVEELCDRRAKAVAKAQGEAAELIRESAEIKKRLDEANHEIRSRREKLQEVEASRAELYKQKAEETAAGGGDHGNGTGNGSKGLLEPGVAEAAEAVLAGLSAEGLEFDKGAMGVLRAVLAAAKRAGTIAPTAVSEGGGAQGGSTIGLATGSSNSSQGSSGGSELNKDLDVDMVLAQIELRGDRETFLVELAAGIKKRRTTK
jgi:hypothetical protein